MDVLEAISTRRSVRRFTAQSVERATLAQLLEAARWAPSRGNRQPWRFVVITQPALLDLVRSVSPGAYFVAPAYLLVCFVPEESRIKESGVPDRMCDCYIAAQNVALAAHALGLGTCMVRSFSQEALREVLGIPPGVVPQLLLALGYPGDVPKVPPRRPVPDIVYEDHYGEPWQL